MRFKHGAAVCVITVGLAAIGGYVVQRTTRAETSATATAPVLFSMLRGANDALVLDVTLRSCFNWERHRFEYTPCPSPRVTVFEYETTRTVNPRTKVESEKIQIYRVGVVTLTAAQVARFDNLLRYYQSRHPVGSVNDDVINVGLFQSGIKTRRVAFRGASGFADCFGDADPQDIAAIPEQTKWFPDARPTLSLRDLIETAEKSGKRNEPVPYVDTPREKTWAYFVSHLPERSPNRKRD